MFKIRITPAHEQATQALRINENTGIQEEATIHAGSFGYLSWAFVTGDVYFPTHRNGAMDFYIYELTQSHMTGDKIAPVAHIHEGDMLIMQSGSSDFPVVKKVGSGFTAFEFWFTESGFLLGTEKADFAKISARQFPMKIIADVVERRIFGEDAPVTHINGLQITEVIIPSLASYNYKLFADRKIAIYVVQGNGKINNHTYITGDFVQVEQRDDVVELVSVQASGEKTTRLIIMDINDLDIKV
ncbi:MAG: hypothetical protein RR346_04150 [Bacteroidales bacterium]